MSFSQHVSQVMRAGHAAFQELHVQEGLASAEDFQVRSDATMTYVQAINAAGTGGTLRFAGGDDANIDPMLDLVDVAGTLTATLYGAVTINGALELDSTLGVDGNFRVGSNGASNFAVTAASGNTSVVGTLDVGGATTLDQVTIDTTDGDFSVSGVNQVTLASSGNEAQSLSLDANGGANESIRIRSQQGTGAASLDLSSTVGGITLSGGLASVDAINLVSSNAAGGI